MIITFIGHASVSSPTRIKELVKEILQRHFAYAEPITCYLGLRGEFDKICALACKDLKQEHRNIELVYVTPYINLSEQTKITEMQSLGLCDTSIYPPIENVPPKFAIGKRNEWMIANANLIIAYIEHQYGGAYQSFQIAKRKQKKIINIYDFL